MRTVFTGWRLQNFSEGPPATGYRAHLYCYRLKFGVQVAAFSKHIKRHFKEAKLAHVHTTVQSIPDTASATQIMTMMRPCIGTSNSRKRSRPGLPMVTDSEGVVCDSVDQARDRWIHFFAAMEGGSRIESTLQRELWIANLHEFASEHFDYKLETLPTLFDLECALRRVKSGKATGDDGIPSEVCGGHPASMARLLYPQLLKLALHGQEALVHKGGRLAIAHKRGPFTECSSYRSLLISSHAGKTIHRTLRQHQQNLYSTYMQSQQVGGRPKVPVNFAVHMVRSHLRASIHEKTSSSLIFLDLTEAFYRILRPLVLRGAWDDHTLVSLAARLKLDHGALHDLRARLAEPDALARAEVPAFHRKYLQALHTDTHFHLDEQPDRVRTTFGSRPGDSFADVVFGFLWARVLHCLEAEMEQRGLLTFLPRPTSNSIFAEVGDAVTPFLGPTWCDDLCICLTAGTAEALESKTTTTLGLILDLCKEHGMSPNLKKGKTEVLFSIRGPGSRELRRKYYGQQGRGELLVLGEHSSYRIGVVGEYKHLGGTVHVSGDMRREIQRRLGVAHATFTKYRRLLFHNAAFTLAKRVTIFQSLVMSQLTYGLESWTIGDRRTRHYLHAAVIRLYRRLLKLPHDAHCSDNEILVKAGLPSPSTLLRCARLRYLGLLHTAGPDDLWSIVIQDVEWLQLVRDDVKWLWNQLCNSSTLCDPETDFGYWEFLMKSHPKFWKRLVARGMKHEILQLNHAWLVHQRSRNIVLALQEYGTLNPGIASPCRDTSTLSHGSIYGCLQCEVACRTKAGEAVHQNRKHGVKSQLRFLYAGTSCPHCLREYHLPERVHHHLRTSRGCREALQPRGPLPEAAVGSGSKAHHVYEEAHNRLIPYQTGAGPKLPTLREGQDWGGVAGEEVDHGVDHELLSRIHQCLDAYHDFPDILFLAEWRATIRKTPVTWTTYCKTLDFLDTDVNAMVPELCYVGLERYAEMRGRLRSLELWPFLKEKTSVEDAHDFGCRERYLRDVLLHPGLSWRRVSIPRGFGKERYLLHFFSGRRRAGDLQFFLDQSPPEGCILHTVSIDIVVDGELGDLMSQEAQQYWINAIKSRYVVGLLGGPPCETWSKARGQALQDRKGPRILRTPDFPWGLESLGLRELAQLIFGSTLLLYMIEAYVYVALLGGAALMEHPAEPANDKEVTIWRLAVVKIVEALPGVSMYTVFQGQMGSESAKPTQLTCANLHTIQRHLRDHRLWPTTPKASSIGLDATGKFRTSRLKEYPPALNRAMAGAFRDAIQTAIFDEALEVPAAFKERCAKLQCAEFGRDFGPDYAPR